MEAKDIARYGCSVKGNKVEHHGKEVGTVRNGKIVLNNGKKVSLKKSRKYLSKRSEKIGKKMGIYKAKGRRLTMDDFTEIEIPLGYLNSRYRRRA